MRKEGQMDLAERVFVFLIGCGVGFVLGYIVAHLRTIERKLDRVDHHVLHHEVIVSEDEVKVKSKDEKGVLSWSWLTFTNVAMSLMLILVAYAAFSAQAALNAVEKNTQSDFVAVCQAGAEIREVQRQTVDAIYQLATQSLERPPGSKPLTDVELQQYNAYIDRVNFFREDMYKKIAPTDVCEPYVTDENVVPPTPSFPHIKRRP
jgi:hypothetical protein